MSSETHFHVQNKMEMQGGEWTKESYYQHLVDIWLKMSSGELSSKEWMNEYDLSFRICTANGEAIVFDANKRVLQNMAREYSTKEDYLKVASNFIRIAAFIHRFWIPNKKRDDPDIKPLQEIAKDAWDAKSAAE